MGRFSPGRTVLSASCTARPRPALPSRCAPPRTDPPVVCPGFGFDRLGKIWKSDLLQTTTDMLDGKAYESRLKK